MQQIYILLCGFQSTNSDRFSGDGYEDPPVPISNTVVKLVNAESTWLETAWEDRKLLIDVKAHLRVCLFCMASYPPRVPGEQGRKRWRSNATTTDSLHHFLPNVRFTELRSGKGKSTVRKQVGQVKGNKNKATTDSLHRLVRSVRWPCSYATWLSTATNTPYPEGKSRT